MKSFLLIAFLASFSAPTNADMQSLLNNLKSHNEQIQTLSINGRAIDSNINFRDKTVLNHAKHALVFNQLLMITMRCLMP